jgi:hypothetical protein
MKHIEIVASFFSIQGLRDEGTGLAIVACAVLYAGIFIWQVIRSLNREQAQELERERYEKTIP